MARLTMMILWPSFLAAIVAEGFFFSVFDPPDLSLSGNYLEMPPMAVYTIGFFCFWLSCALASTLTCYLLSVPAESKPPF